MNRIRSGKSDALADCVYYLWVGRAHEREKINKIQQNQKNGGTRVLQWHEQSLFLTIARAYMRTCIDGEQTHVRVLKGEGDKFLEMAGGRIWM